MKRVLITGGTGLVGSQLATQFDEALVTTRNPDSAQRKVGENVTAVRWPSYELPLDLSQCGELSAVVHLMGESVATGRWSTEKKKRILDSRVLGTRHLIDALEQLPERPDCLVTASAVGYYADSGDRFIDETHGPGDGFLSDVCQQWESAATRAKDLGIRLVTLRIGIVLSAQGGALAQMLPIFRKGLGGRLGNGQHYFPWIHIDDLVKMITWSIDQPVSGVFNATAPHPVTNAEFTQVLASTLNRPALFPVPRFALKLAVGEFANSLFDSHRVIPKAATESGFQFDHDELQPALENLLNG